MLRSIVFAAVFSCSIIAYAQQTSSAPASAPENASQPAGAFDGRARAFVGLLAKGRFDQAYQKFDSAMRQALPVEKLAEAWQGVVGGAGSFQRIVMVRTQKVAGFEAVFVTCQFEHQRLDTKVVYDSVGQVTGLWFVPTVVATGDVTPPRYVDPKRFEEKQVQVGVEGWPLPATLTLPRNQTAPSAANVAASAPSSAPAKHAHPAIASLGREGMPPAPAAQKPQRWPAVVLVHGSGPQDRDESIGGCKPFRDLAWGLAARGIAVLRYEKRTLQHAERFSQIGTITVREETVDDAVSAVWRVSHDSEIDPQRIFILGHSLGGTLLPRIAREAPQAAGMIIISGSTRPLADVIMEQMRGLTLAKGSPSFQEQEQLKILEKQAKLADSPSLTPDARPEELPLGLPASYWIDLRGYDPVSTARTLRRPMLILHGARDYQVTQEDLEGWKAGLAGQADVKIIQYPSLNHLMIAGQGRSTAQEYDTPGHVDEQVIEDISRWILAQKP